ncbi:MAG: hypothetical protein ACFFDP_11210, partial [Promethearchaeota archaeon]
PASIDVNRTASTAFSFTVTVDAVGTKTLYNVRVYLSYDSGIQLLGTGLPTILGDLNPGSFGSVTFNFVAAADGDYLVNVIIKFDDLGGSSFSVIDSVSVHAYTSTPPWTPPTTTTTTPIIPGFPIEAIAMGAFLALGFGVISRRRKRRK